MSLEKPLTPEEIEKIKEKLICYGCNIPNIARDMWKLFDALAAKDEEIDSYLAMHKERTEELLKKDAVIKEMCVLVEGHIKETCDKCSEFKKWGCSDQKSCPSFDKWHAFINKARGD